MLKKYEEKRDFSKTPEPSAELNVEGAGPLRFCVQKHNARRLHYDVRLELDGAMLSWAVPKGPSYNPDDKHLAVHVEDHPLDYANFEGIIPKGEYGGGEVIVWDEGFYSPDDKGVLSFEDRDEAEKRMRADLKKGKLSITFRGHKLSGSWTIVKTRSKSSKSDDWLMIKHRDGTERDDFDVTTLDRSVKTGRSIEDVQAGRTGNLLSAEDVSGAVRKSKMPVVKSPMAATEAKKPFNKKGWIFELKIDGIRVLAHKDDGRITLYSRNGNDVTMKFPKLVEELGQLPYRSFILDGETVCYDADGKPSFQCLLQRFQLQDSKQIAAMESKLPIEYCVFDLLYLDGWDIRGVKLEDRRALLDQMNPRTTTIRVLDVFPEDGEMLFEHATQLGFEGVVGKKLDSRYKEGIRSVEWVKVKQHHTDEFIVVGWLPGQGNRSSTFGSLILATKDENGTLKYAGNVGGGFNDTMLDEVLAKITALPPAKKPFTTKIEGESKAKWVEPRLVAEVKFAQRTQEGLLRFPVFLRFRPEWDTPADFPEPNEVDQRGTENSKLQNPKSKIGDDPFEALNEVQEEVKTEAKRSGYSKVQSPKSKVDEEGEGSAKPKLDGVLEQLKNPREEFQIEVEGSAMKVSSASKVLWPATGDGPAITKRDLLIYYTRVSEYMIPHLRDRPIAFVRLPQGLAGERFFQKHWDHRPDFVARVNIWSSHVGKATEYLMCNNLATLLWLGQIAALEIHPWYSRVNPKPDTDLPTNFAPNEEALDASVLNYPDFMVVDLDPNIGSASKADGGENVPNRVAWEKTVEAALPLKELLDSIGLKGYLKTSGKTGLHVYIPIKRVYDYGTVRLMCETIGRHLLEQIPDILTMEWKVAKRPAKIFFDHNQNVRGKTLVSIYSPRPISGAPVSFPISWQELEKGLYPSDFRIDNVPGLLEERGDLWDEILKVRQTIGAYT
jgi:bifunctional non-homologous end joining protein LigD